MVIIIYRALSDDGDVYYWVVLHDTRTDPPQTFISRNFKKEETLTNIK